MLNSECAHSGREVDRSQWLKICYPNPPAKTLTELLSRYVYELVVIYLHYNAL